MIRMIGLLGFKIADDIETVLGFIIEDLSMITPGIQVAATETITGDKFIVQLINELFESASLTRVDNKMNL